MTVCLFNTTGSVCEPHTFLGTPYFIAHHPTICICDTHMYHGLLHFVMHCPDANMLHGFLPSVGLAQNCLIIWPPFFLM